MAKAILQWVVEWVDDEEMLPSFIDKGELIN